MEKLNLFWYKLNKGSGNFGDELNHYIISKLTNKEVNNIIIPSSGYDYIYKGLQMIKRGVSLKKIPILISQFFINNFIVAIGSVLSHVNSASCKVWGSGIISKNDIINPAQFYAVRGKYTQNRMKELNLLVPDTIGDPALLLPLLYSIQKKNKYKIGVIPHYVHYSDVKSNINSEEVLIIDLTNSIEQIVKQINSCQYTISTSLHGIIVSQSYGIPSLWYNIDGKKLGGDNVKFYDYFSSVLINEYKPFELKLKDFNLSEVIVQVEENLHLSLILEDLESIQNSLINAAPFSILKKFKQL